MIITALLSAIGVPGDVAVAEAAAAAASCKWTAMTVSAKCLARTFSSLIRSCTEKGRKKRELRSPEDVSEDVGLESLLPAATAAAAAAPLTSEPDRRRR